MTDTVFIAEMGGYGLIAVQIHYYLPNPRILRQQFVMQQSDLAPQLPELDQVLPFWRCRINAVRDSVRVAHKHLIGPQEWRPVDAIMTIN